MQAHIFPEYLVYAPKIHTEIYKKKEYKYRENSDIICEIKKFKMCTMDSLDIRDMLSYVGNNTPCPLCKSKIPSSAIEIIETAGEHCAINFSCDKCKEDFSGQIQMKRIPLPNNSMLNASTLVEKERGTVEQISQNEVQAMHNALDKDISFNDLFGESAGIAKKNK